MSGLEAVGIAAGIIQIADLGTKLSVKLFSSYRRMKNASQSIQNLSSDVALTCAILRELGESLASDEQSKLCSEEAFRTARHILTQCEEVLRQIQDMIRQTDLPKRSRLQQAADSFRNVLIEPDLDLLKQNLERLKLTMLLLLNVIMYAGQVRNHVPTMLHEQRTLIERLLEEKQNDESPSPQPTEFGTRAQTDNSSQLSKTSTGSALNETPLPQKRDSEELDELGEYNALIQKMVHEIDSCKSKLETSRHSRIKKGVLGIHDTEVVRFQLTHGNSVLGRFDASLFEESVSNAPPPPSGIHSQKPPTWSEPVSIGFSETKRPTAEAIDESSSEDNDNYRRWARAAADQRAREADEAFMKAAESDARQSKRSWEFAGWLGSNRTNTDTASGPIKAKLGQESLFYYDHRLQQWARKRDAPYVPPPPPRPSSRPAPRLVPPPKGSGRPCRSSCPMPISEPKVSCINVPSSAFYNRHQSAATGSTVLLPTSGSTNPPRSQESLSHADQIDHLLLDGPPVRRRGSGRDRRKDRYVDVLADKIAQTPSSMSVIPPAPLALEHASKENAVPPDDFESLVLRWTMLGKDEILGLGL